MRKKGIVESQTFNHLLAIVVVMLVLVFGIHSLTQIDNSQEEVESELLERQILQDTKAHAVALGTESKKSYLAEGFTHYCAIDMKFSSEISWGPHIPAWIQESVSTGAQDNFFMYSKDRQNSFSVEGLAFPDYPHHVCGMIDDGELELTFLGLGDAVTIGSNNGGSGVGTPIQSADGVVELSVPPTAAAIILTDDDEVLVSDIEVTVSSPTDQSYDQKVYHFEPSGAEFSEPVKITIQYDSEVYGECPQTLYFDHYSDEDFFLESIEAESINCESQEATFLLDSFSNGHLAPPSSVYLKTFLRIKYLQPTTGYCAPSLLTDEQINIKKAFDRWEWPMIDRITRNSKNVYMIGTAGYTLDAYLRMYQATKDVHYLHRVANAGKYALNRRDNVLGRVDYRGVSGPVWSTSKAETPQYFKGNPNSNTRYAFSVHTARMVYPLAQFANIVLNNPCLHDLELDDGTTFKERADEFVVASKQALAYFDHRYRKISSSPAKNTFGFYIFPANARFVDPKFVGKALPVNQQSRLGRAYAALFKATGEQKYRTRAREIGFMVLYEFRDNIYSGIKWNYWGTLPHAKKFATDITRPEDFSHSVATFDFVREMYENTLGVFTRLTIRKLGMTFDDTIERNLHYSAYIDGTTTFSGDSNRYKPFRSVTTESKKSLVGSFAYLHEEYLGRIYMSVRQTLMRDTKVLEKRQGGWGLLSMAHLMVETNKIFRGQKEWHTPVSAPAQLQEIVAPELRPPQINYCDEKTLTSTQSSLKASYDRQIVSEVNRFSKHDNSLGTLSARGADVADSLLRMYEATRDRKYLVLAAKLGQGMLDARDDRKGVTDYTGKSNPVWSIDYTSTGRNNRFGFLGRDARIAYPLAEFARIVNNNPCLHDNLTENRITFKRQADIFTRAVTETTRYHNQHVRRAIDRNQHVMYFVHPPNAEFVPDYTHNQIVPTRSLSAMGRVQAAMFLATGVEGYYANAVRLAHYVRGEFRQKQNRYEFTHWPRKAHNSEPLPPHDAVEDAGSMSDTMNFVRYFSEHNLGVFSRGRLDILANTFIRYIHKDHGRVARTIDGKGTAREGVSYNIGSYTFLHHQQERVYRMVRNYLINDFRFIHNRPGASGLLSISNWMAESVDREKGTIEYAKTPDIT